jgi:hypothetical protein
LKSVARTYVSSRVIVTSTMSVLALMALGSSAQADVNLVTNGGFETTSTPTGGSYQINNTNPLYLADWSSNPACPGCYNYVYFPGQVTIAQGGAADPQPDAGAGNDHVYLWAPNNTGNFPLSPNGGNFVALDADPAYRSVLTQQINGLTVGQGYDLTFYWGGAQYTTRTGPTTENVIVSLGGETHDTATISDPSQSFTGWQPEVHMTFTADNTSEVLSFLADGTPSNLPPVVVLDGISLTATPEPGYWMVMVLGLGILVFAARRRSKSANQSV